jgi:excisionase family DNA binding protein
MTALATAPTTIRKAMTNDGADEPRFVDAANAARILGVTVKTIRKEAAAGRIPAVRVGREWRFLLDDLRNLTRRGSQSPE